MNKITAKFGEEDTKKTDIRIKKKFFIAKQPFTANSTLTCTHTHTVYPNTHTHTHTHAHAHTHI